MKITCAECGTELYTEDRLQKFYNYCYHCGHEYNKGKEFREEKR